MTVAKNYDTLKPRGGRPARKAMSILGSMIDGRMAELGLKQSAFAELCGISESQLSLLRSGGRGREMRIDTAAKLAAGLGITVDDFLTAKETPRPVDGTREDTKSRPRSGRRESGKRIATT